jgi:hypothetical protein
METLDRRISASTDQLDTLKREKKSDRSVWGLPPEDVGGRHSRGHYFQQPFCGNNLSEKLDRFTKVLCKTV